jgi:hypothetical protein
LIVVSASSVPLSAAAFCCRFDLIQVFDFNLDGVIEVFYCLLLGGVPVPLYLKLPHLSGVMNLKPNPGGFPWRGFLIPRGVRVIGVDVVW